MMRSALVTSFVLVAALAALSCKDPGGDAAAGDGGKAAKLICKMNNQCWVCPSEDAMKKCIINPATSGCKPSTGGDCQ